MSTKPISITVRAPRPGVAVLAIAGDVTAAAQDALAAAHEEATAAGANVLVLDFSGMDYMNSGGIGMLVTLLVRAQRNKQGLAAIGLTEHYRQIFQLTRLDEAIALHTDESVALASA